MNVAAVRRARAKKRCSMIRPQTNAGGYPINFLGPRQACVHVILRQKERWAFGSNACASELRQTYQLCCLRWSLPVPWVPRCEVVKELSIVGGPPEFHNVPSDNSG